MKKFMMFTLIAVFSVAVLCMGVAKNADALMMATSSNGIATMEFTDDVSGGFQTVGVATDINFSDGDTVFGIFKGLGFLQTNVDFATGGQLQTTTSQSKPFLGSSATNPVMDLAGTATNAGTFTVELSDDNWGPTSLPFAFFVDGNHSGGGDTTSFTINVWADAGNVLFAKTTFLGGTTVFGSPTNASLTTLAFAGVLPYSLTIQAIIVQTGSGTTTFNIGMEPVPEPGTIALLGIGLAGLVGVGVRRKMKKNVD